jgi:hypothetical protein
MWYSIEYIWQALIIPELTVSRLVALEEILWCEDDEISRNLELTKDKKKIERRWAEKSRDFEISLNSVINKMREKWYKDFDLDWDFKYQWEEIDDRWYIKKIDWVYTVVEITWLVEWEIKCPHCGEIFILEK